MNGDAPRSAPATDVVRRLLDRAAPDTAVQNPQEAAAALQRACSRVRDNLREFMGDDGCTALLARALARTEAQHPALVTVRHLNGGGISLDGVAESVDLHGVRATTAAIEALLLALADVLGRLIGENMAAKVMESDAPGRRRQGDGREA